METRSSETQVAPRQDRLDAGREAHHWEEYLFMPSLLRRLGDAAFVYRAVPIALRGCAALLILSSLAIFFQSGKLIFELPTTAAIFGGVMYEFMFILAIYAVVHVMIIRARDISRLKPREIYMIPMGALLMRMAAEAYASFVSLIAIGGGLFVWFTGKTVEIIFGPLTILFPTVGRDSTFLGGIEVIVTGLLMAVAALIVAYSLAEFLLLLARLAGMKEEGNPGPRRSGNRRPSPFPARLG